MQFFVKNIDLNRSSAKKFKCKMYMYLTWTKSLQASGGIPQQANATQDITNVRRRKVVPVSRKVAGKQVMESILERPDGCTPLKQEKQNPFTLKNHCSFNVIFYNVPYKYNGINWSNAMNIQSALWVLRAWCFSTRASVATVLSLHPFVSRILGV